MFAGIKQSLAAAFSRHTRPDVFIPYYRDPDDAARNNSPIVRALTTPVYDDRFGGYVAYSESLRVIIVLDGDYVKTVKVEAEKEPPFEMVFSSVPGIRIHRDMLGNAVTRAVERAGNA